MTYVDVQSSMEFETPSTLHRLPSSLTQLVQNLPRLRWMLLAAGAVLLLAVAGWFALSGRSAGYAANQSLIFHSVSRGNLPITVVERGNLESQKNVQVYCDVDDFRNDGIHGTPIIWIVPNGSSVNKGDLLVELDATALREELDEQLLDTEQARAEQLQAHARLENQLTQNETARENAELQVKLAELDLQMFEDKQNGTHKLEVEEIERAIDDLNNEILAARANLELKRNEANGIESLFKLGYAGKSELDRSRLEFLQAESQYTSKMNRMETELATLEKKKTYEHEMQLLKLRGEVETAKRSLQQVLRDNEAELAQAKARAAAAAESLKKEEERLIRYQSQLEKCKIYAPQDGMVAYAASSRENEIREGTAVRPRQHILSLPNLRKMHVKTAVHESVLDQIQPKLAAKVSVDAFPDRKYTGEVRSVAVLPDQSNWFSSETKVYETIVYIEEEVQQLKPGMTAVVEILVDRLENVLTVPIQAIVQVDNRNWCYVESGGQIERRSIAIGRTNDKYVHIREGLEEGDRVVLNPMSIADSERDEAPADEPQVSSDETEVAKA